MPVPFVIAAMLTAAAPDPMSAPIVAAENAFSADARRYGVRLAFLAHFDAGSWLFRPYPVPALDALARDGDDGAPLEWGPDTVGVSASGDMGFTSGPWTAHAAGTDGLVHGHFLTVWKRGEDGIWRVQVDAGVSHPALAKPATSVDVVVHGDDPPTKALMNDEIAKRRAQLERTDDTLRHALADTSGDKSTLWLGASDPGIRVLRSGHTPATGKEAQELAAHDAPRIGSGPRRALDVASGGDLGYTIGGDASCAACGTYYRIWRWQDGAWFVLVDLSKP
jgi:hypothetical protein